jgi:Arm DNA-binding domain/Phage integrase central domain
MLNDTRVRSAKSREKAFKLSDERGLFLLVMPTGSRLWRLKYRVNGREKLISLGAYPDVTLKRAREKRDAARRLIADGIEPSVQRKAERAALAQSFEGVAKEWLELQTKSLAPETISILTARLDSGLYPYIGGRPIAAITAQELLGALRRIEARGRAVGQQNLGSTGTRSWERTGIFELPDNRRSPRTA